MSSLVRQIKNESEQSVTYKNIEPCGYKRKPEIDLRQVLLQPYACLPQKNANRPLSRAFMLCQSRWGATAKT